MSIESTLMKTGLALLLGGTLNAHAASVASDLEAQLARAITNQTYQPPTRTELARARELFTHTLKGDRPVAELKAGWIELGFAFQEISADHEVLCFVSEPAGKEFGRGWYLFRTNRESTIAWEAPHSKNDVHTGVIALRLFLAGNARALAA